MTMPDQLQLDLLFAMFHSTGLFAGGPCCLIRARPFSLAWTTNTTRSINVNPWKKKKIPVEQLNRLTMHYP